MSAALRGDLGTLMGEAKKSGKAGRNSAKCKAYRAAGTEYVNKLKRVLDSNGPVAALNYAQQFECFAALRMLRKRKPVAFQRAIDMNDEFARWANGR